MFRSLALILVALAMTANASLAAVAQDATPPTSPSLLASMGYPGFLITVTDDAYELPEQVTAGRYLIVYENEAQASRKPFLLRLPESISLDVLQATPAAGEDEGPPPWLLDSRFPGFTGETLPGQTSYAVVDLAPGNYLLVDDFTAGFEVVPSSEASPTPAAAPAADGTLRLFEYGFQFPDELVPGRQVWTVVNSGQGPHELLLLRSPEAVTVEQVVEYLASPSEDENAPLPGGGPAWSELVPVGGIGWLSPGATAWTEVVLEPGHYIALCFVFDPATGMPHAAMGMVDVFTIGEPGTPTSRTAAT